MPQNIRKNLQYKKLGRVKVPAKYSPGTAAIFCVMGALLLAGHTTRAHADTSQTKTDVFLARTLAAKQHTGESAVIMKLAGECTAAREAQLKALGATVTVRLPLIQSISVRVPNCALSQLVGLPWVKHLSADLAVKKTDEYTVGATSAWQAWGAPNYLSGNGVGVAVLDSGIHEQHPDLCQYLIAANGKIDLSKDRVLQSVNFVDSRNDPAAQKGIIASLPLIPGLIGLNPPPAANSPAPWNSNYDMTVPDRRADDQCGHGTHVAGILAGNATQSVGLLKTHSFFGIAPAASLVNVRVLNAYGQSDVSTVVAGIQWVVNSVKHQNPYNIRVMNLSVGHPVGDYYANDPLCQAVEAAYKAGLVVVCAAGNDGRANDNMPNPPCPDNEGYGTAYGSIDCPGNDPYIITVGAMKQVDGLHSHDRAATYSSRGPTRLDLTLKPDIAAPGNRIVSLNVANSYFDLNYAAQINVMHNEYIWGGDSKQSGSYVRLSGTSMATPVVSGAAALMLQADPTLSPDTIKARLMIAADKWTDADGNSDPCTYGAGYLNIPVALQSKVIATQPAMSPTLSQDDQGNVYVNMDRALWGTRAIWGTDITDLRAIWGTRAVWGVSTNILNSSRALWGTNVWGDRALWGTSTTQADLSSKVVQGEK